MNGEAEKTPAKDEKTPAKLDIHNIYQNITFASDKEAADSQKT